jgi:hypothetical protein
VEADRDRVEAAGCLRGEKVHRREVRLVDREVDVVEAEALGGGARELLDAERARLHQHLLGRVAGGPALLDGGLDALLRHEAELDDDVGDESRGAAAAAGGGDAGERLARTSGCVGVAGVAQVKRAQRRGLGGAHRRASATV